ncbi:unnamed protein product [Dibothriocephalus latus]|uniref:Uncharacterized protein n=1 Tax=Dibothriocephalus latus TaxID=60516 RepID=A0A3P7KUR3_DIBLA|nr:unnamed protein product [Dibothriocephalus latus]
MVAVGRVPAPETDVTAARARPLAAVELSMGEKNVKRIDLDLLVGLVTTKYRKQITLSRHQRPSPRQSIPQTATDNPPQESTEPVWDGSNDMEEPNTPDITEDHPPENQSLPNTSEAGLSFEQSDNMPPGLAVALMLRNRPPPPPQPQAPDFANWQQPNQRFLNRPTPPAVQPNGSAQFLPNPFTPAGAPFQGVFPAQNFYPREMSASFIPQRPALNTAFQGAQANRFPVTVSRSQILAMGGMVNPLMPPVNMAFGSLITQPPPPPPLPPHLSCAYSAPPPPPFIPFPQPPPIAPPISPSVSSVPQQFQQRPQSDLAETHFQPSDQNALPSPQQPSFADPSSCEAPPSNLLETLMSQAGLPTDSLNRINSTQGASEKMVLPDALDDKSPMKKINNLLNTAANTLLTHLSEKQRTNNDSPPPPPPPPLPLPSHTLEKDGNSAGKNSDSFNRSPKPGCSFTKEANVLHFLTAFTSAKFPVHTLRFVPPSCVTRFEGLPCFMESQLEVIKAQLRLR